LYRVDCPEVDVAIYPPCVTELEGEAHRCQTATICVVPSKRGEERGEEEEMKRRKKR
jgi:hypothetical protein